MEVRFLKALFLGKGDQETAHGHTDTHVRSQPPAAWKRAALGSAGRIGGGRGMDGSQSRGDEAV